MGKSLKGIAKVGFSWSKNLVTGNFSNLKKETKQGVNLALGKKTTATGDTASLRKEKEDESKKRVRLYSTGNGELGEEVESVLSSEKRGKLFRNE